MTRRVTLPLVAVASVVVAALLALTATGSLGGLRLGAGLPGGPEPAPPGATSDDDPWRAADFLETYVDDDGRVVRTDQGGDTVSEGQAYAMLIALGADDRERFDDVWSWTQDNLLRPDGLISWRWEGGEVVDPSSAADADLDVARALLLAASTWDEPAYAAQGAALGEAILDHETARTEDGLVLLAGSWALEGNDDGPWAFNPSYVSPVATELLAAATGDPRWDEMTTGSRAAVEAVAPEGRLPPDWAEVTAQGDAYPVGGPGGLPVQYSYDAPRTIIRHAESCVPEDLEIARQAVTVLGEQESVGTHDLDGVAQGAVASPLATVAQASGLAAAGEGSAAETGIRLTEEQRRQSPTYYGDAWAVLGPMLLTDDTFGGCPAAVAS